jgi:predicted metal-dependent hydrolase
VTLNLQGGKRAQATAFDGVTLTVSVPDAANHDAIRRTVLRWVGRYAREDFQRRLELLSAKLGVNTPPLFLSSARTRWGSCNSRGEIRLNWRLIQAPPRIIHYVICHELAHLKEMNHSPKFWAWVERLCPDYPAARNELTAMSAQLHRI